jgi:hypothetical protein
MAFLSVVVNVVDGSGIGSENHLSHVLQVLPITPTTSAHYREPQKVLRVRSSCVMENNKLLCHSCELVPAVPSLPPCHLHRDNRLRSHPSHLASPASMPTHPPPQSSKVRRRTPTTPPVVFVVSLPRTLDTNTAPFSSAHFIDRASWCASTSHLSDCGLCPPSSKDAAKNQLKSGNFNWLHR